ncbi:MAG: hypothetical protein V3U87_10250 [Methylococcaceae bacterium]
MTLDIHIAKSEKEAIKEAPISFFSEEVHNSLFYCFGLSEFRYPLFFRMKDYYSDAKYEVKEIETLILEMQKIKIEFIENKKIITELENLKSIAIKAQKENLNIWVYCD